MRFLPLLSLAMLTCCSAPPGDPVSKSYPGNEFAGSSLPAIQNFAAPSVGPIIHSNAELAQLFLRLEFQLESGRDLLRISRFEGPITVALAGNVPNGAKAELTRLIARFQSEAGLNVSLTTAADPAISVNFVPAAQMKRLVPSAACFVVPGVTSLAEYSAARGGAAVDWAQITQRSRVAVFVPENSSPQEVRDCLHEELAQAMGPLNDLYELGDSVFNDDNFNTVLTNFDMLMLRLHYAPELVSGMNEAQVASLLSGMLAKYNPTGAYNSGIPAPPPSPIAWSNLVAKAMGIGGASGRKVAAEQMIAMAGAQGWNDSRLGLAYFLSGRLAAQTNAAKAVEYFSLASQIYRSVPNGALHAAHVDLQLAAIALSANQNEQAIAFVDRSLGAVTSGQNAAMLSTLMLIKAEALDELGRTSEAQALRLDTVGWARYGFGSDQALRAKTAEIAALAARG